MGRPLNILYIRTENSSGTLSLFADAHKKLGNNARYVTLFPTAEGFPEDICLDLPLLPKNKRFIKAKEIILSRESRYKEAEGFPPQWNPSLWERAFFKTRDLIWKPYIKKALIKYNLLDFDIYHLEGGHGFLRMSAWPFDDEGKKGKHFLANYHGVDMRTRGVFLWIDQLVDINTSSELDLLAKHPNMQYVFLPYTVEAHVPTYDSHSKLKICHATRDRRWKGSETIIDACRRLEKKHDVEFVLIENRSHKDTLKIKAECDIYIDQVSNMGGWGYGMNSVEALSMGLCCCTNLLPEYEAFLGQHPFVNVKKETLYEDLAALINDRGLIEKQRFAGRAWVEQTHSVKAVMKSIYDIYLQQKWIERLPDGL